jgi:hypothetical protein
MGISKNYCCLFFFPVAVICPKNVTIAIFINSWFFGVEGYGTVDCADCRPKPVLKAQLGLKK